MLEEFALFQTGEMLFWAVMLTWLPGLAWEGGEPIFTLGDDWHGGAKSCWFGMDAECMKVPSVDGLVGAALCDA